MILATVLAGVVGAALGAALGAYLNHRLPRALPMVLIHSIELSTALVNRDEVVEKQTLIREMNEFRYDVGVTSLRGRMKMGEWLEYLNAYRGGLEDVTADIDEAQSIVRQTRDLVAAEDFGAARPKLAGNHFWWHMLEGRYRVTQVEVFSAEVRTRLDSIKSDDDLVETLDDGDYLVKIENGRTVLFDWSKLQPAARKNAAKQLALRCALALAHNDKAALLDLFDYVRQEIPEAKEKAGQLAKAIEEELREYQHIVVTGLLMNTGRLEYLVDSQARLGIKMKGYPRRRTEESDPRDELITEDAAIDMVVETVSEEKEIINDFMRTFKAAARARRVTSQSGQPRNVIAVGSGDPTIVRLVSRQRLKRMELSNEFIRAYEGGERQAYVILSIIKPRQTEPQAWYSDDVPFRNIIHQAALPLKKP